MIHVGVIVAFLIVYMRDALGAPALEGRLDATGIIAWSLMPLIVMGVTYSAYVRVCGRRIDRRGSHRAVRGAERATRVFLIGALIQHALAVLVFGLLDLVRLWIGNPILLDELLVLLAPVLAMSFAYFVMYPIDRRLREAALFATIERGEPVHPFPSRARFVMLSTRQQVLFLLVPLSAILAWGEGSARGLALLDIAEDSAIAAAVQMSGAIAVLALMPPVLCRLWDTVPLGEGPVRSAIARICDQHRASVRELLLWRTGGTMVNAAVIGILPRLRYVVVTDALLEMLEPDQVEAVAAHEVGHVLRRHMLWLGLSVLGVVLVLGSPLGWAGTFVLNTSVGSLAMGEEAVMVALLGLTLIGVLLALGFVSRRFEWQADAFAAQHMSGMRPGASDVRITPEAVESMASALDSVANLNAIDPGRFTWRHGSIRERQRRLRALVGVPANELGADRLANSVKLWCLASLVLGACLIALDMTVFS